jgi:hypothetical protein
MMTVRRWRDVAVVGCPARLFGGGGFVQRCGQRSRHWQRLLIGRRHLVDRKGLLAALCVYMGGVAKVIWDW